MSSIAGTFVEERQQVLAFLSTHRDFPLRRKQLEDHLDLQTKLRKILVFTGSLLQLYGRHCKDRLKQTLDPKLHPLLQRVSNAYCEIQEKLEAGISFYASFQFPVTDQVLQEYRPTGVSDEEFFEKIQRGSYYTLPFLQRALRYKNPDKELLQQIEMEREKALHALNRCLILPEESESKECLPPIQEEVLEIDEFSLTQLVYSGGALVDEKKQILYFIDLIQTFYTGSSRHMGLVRKFFEEHVRSHHWMKGCGKKIQEFEELAVYSSTFQDFLIRCTLFLLEKILRVAFSPPLHRSLASTFRSEKFRSDVAYFTGFELLHATELFSRRPSAPLLLSLCHFLDCRDFVREVMRSPLLEMLVHRNPYWPLDKLPETVKPRENLEENHWVTAWRSMEKCICSLLHREELDWAHLPPEAEKILQESSAWPLFFFFLHNPNNLILADFFYLIAIDRSIHLSLQIIYEFSASNPSLLREDATLFAEQYLKSLAFLREKGVPIDQGEILFLSPPLALSPPSFSVWDVLLSTETFYQQMAKYSWGDKKRNLYLFLLRQFVVQPFLLMLRLLEQVAPALGIQKLSEDFLFRILTTDEYDLLIGEQKHYSAACAIANRLQERYLFSSEELFFLFLEILRCLVQTNQKSLATISSFIWELEQFCPAIPKKAIYFLYRYRPELSLEAVKELASFRKEWFASTKLDAFILPLDKIEEIHGRIGPFCEAIANFGPQEEREAFCTSLASALVFSFFAPTQSLTDYFKISNLDAEKGIRWMTFECSTHLGQRKPIVKDTPLSIYVLWQAMKGYPVLFFTFSHLQDKKAQSTFIRLDIPMRVFQEREEKRRDLFIFLHFLSRQVLAREDLPAEIAREEGAEAGSLRKEEIHKIWSFIERVKIQYRELYLLQIAPDSLIMDPSLPSRRIAAQGNIHPSHPRGSLLPEPLQRIEPFFEFYIPDLTEEEVAPLSELFRKTTPRQLLPHALIVTPDGNTKISLPLSYSVQTVNDLRASFDEAAPEEKWNEEEQIFYVTLSIEVGNGRPWEKQRLDVPLQYPPEAFANPLLFQEYFDFQVLVLKASYYQYSTGFSSPSPPG